MRDRSWMEVAGDVSLPDSGQEVPRAVREGIICNVHGPMGTGTYAQFDFEHIDFDDPDQADLIYNLLHGGNDPDDDIGIDDSQYQYPFSQTGYDNDDASPGYGGDNLPPTMPDTTTPTPTPTPTPMPERTPIALPPEVTPEPTAEPIIGDAPGDPGLPPPGDPGASPTQPPGTSPGFGSP